MHDKGHLNRALNANFNLELYLHCPRLFGNVVREETRTTTEFGRVLVSTGLECFVHECPTMFISFFPEKILFVIKIFPPLCWEKIFSCNTCEHNYSMSTKNFEKWNWFLFLLFQDLALSFPSFFWKSFISQYNCLWSLVLRFCWSSTSTHS